MRFVLPSAAKLNLSLRVTGKREDGYHDIVSLFWRLPSAETLLVSELRDGGGDLARVLGVEVNGENIVSRALRCARDAGAGTKKIPFLDVEIRKALYPGSGLGAGSGNGAAILRWLAGGAGIGDKMEGGAAWRDVALKCGADVPFLFSGFPLARVSGVGEIVEPLEPLKNISAWVIFPDWDVGTENAYKQLDRRYGGAYPLNGEKALAEVERLIQELREGKRTGLLPNDFTPGLMEKIPDYGELFGALEEAGALAWGITGSGGAAFALFQETAAPFSFEWPSWVKQVMAFSRF
jgi:4-diphosphocytidyl-2-C-methyl-D-erythritol kinase